MPRDSSETIRSAAQLIQLADLLARRLQASMVHSLLVQACDDILESSQDANGTINQAVQAAPTLVISRTIRRAAEYASERVKGYRDGASVEMSLFALPIIASFKQEVPESHFEAALGALSCSSHLPSVLDCAVGEVKLLPTLFHLEDLKHIPFSQMKKAAITLAWPPWNAQGTPHPFRAQAVNLKRSATFLRYLVGQRLVLDRPRSPRATSKVCKRLQELMKQEIKRELGLTCAVKAFYVGSFYDPLYSAMWLYQEQRLDQLARATSRQALTQMVEARVAMLGGAAEFDIRVGFFAGQQPVGGHAYLLSSRPSEDPRLRTRQVTKRIEAAGVPVKTVPNVGASGPIAIPI